MFECCNNSDPVLTTFVGDTLAVRLVFTTSVPIDMTQSTVSFGIQGIVQVNNIEIEQHDNHFEALVIIPALQAEQFPTGLYHFGFSVVQNNAVVSSKDLGIVRIKQSPTSPIQNLQ